MGKVAIVPCDLRSRELFLVGLELPDNYMADYSVMGFMVDRFSASLTLLGAAGYSVTALASGAEVSVDGPAGVAAVRALLVTHGIGCEFADIADTIYQA